MYYVLVGITWRNWTCYNKHYQDEVFSTDIYGRHVCIFLLLKTYISPKLIFYVTKGKDLVICALELEPKSFKLNV